MAWFNAVSLASGMNESELEVLFGESTSRQRYTPGARPGLWRKYKMGRICPKTKADINGRPSIVERVDRQFPGTAKWMSMPFWDVLSYKRMDMAELRQVYVSLSPSVRDLIVMDPQINGRMFWRRSTAMEALYDELIEVGGIDAATAILALIKEAEITQNQIQHQYGLVYWARCTVKLQHPVISPLIAQINEVIEDRFTRISYATNDGMYFRQSKQNVRSVLAGESKKLDLLD